jgi:hypothetical protein
MFIPLIADSEAPVFRDVPLLPRDVDSYEASMLEGVDVPSAWILKVHAENTFWYRLGHGSDELSNELGVNIELWTQCLGCRETIPQALDLAAVLDKANVRYHELRGQTPCCSHSQVYGLFSALVIDPENIKFPSRLGRLKHAWNLKHGPLSRMDYPGIHDTDVTVPETEAYTKGTVPLHLPLRRK